MKKLMMCLLSLSVILSGCVQEEQPEEPPVVDEENEKLPDENLDENKNNQENNKIGDEEDNKQDTNENIQRIDKNQNWIVIEEEQIKDLTNEQMIYEYSNGNDFENWFNNTYFYEPVLSKFYINIKNNTVRDINNEVADRYDEYIDLPFGFHYQDVKYFESTNILSVIIKYGVFLPGSTCEAFHEIINIDLTTGLPLSNKELLDKYNIGFYEVVQRLDNYYDSINSISCIGYDNLSEEDKQICHGDLDVLKSVGADDLLLFVDENDRLITLHPRMSLNNDTYRSTYFKFDLGLPEDNLNDQTIVDEIDKHVFTEEIIETDYYTIKTTNYDFVCEFYGEELKYYCGVQEINFKLSGEEFDEINESESNHIERLIQHTQFLTPDIEAEEKNTERGRWRSYGSKEILVYEDDNLISICNLYITVYPDSFIGYNYSSYNIDIKNGKVLKPLELIEYLEIDVDKLIHAFNSYLYEENRLLKDGESGEENPFKREPFNEETLFANPYLTLCLIDDQIGIQSRNVPYSDIVWFDLENLK